MRGLRGVVVLTLLGVGCGRSALDEEERRDGGPQLGPAGNPWSVAFPSPPATALDGSATSDAGADPDDEPWLGDSSPFDASKVDCLDLDAGLACGLLTPKQLEAICRSPRTDWEAEYLAFEAVDQLVADDVTYSRVVRDLALLRAFDATLEDRWHFRYDIYPLDIHFQPADFEQVADGANTAFNCLFTSLRVNEYYLLRSSSGVRLYFAPRLNVDFVRNLYFWNTPTFFGGWARAAGHRCLPDICLAIERSRFVYVVKEGDCNAPSHRTFVVGLDGGITTSAGWDQQRYPSCKRWFDQAKWLP